MKNRLSIGGEQFSHLYIDDKLLQDKFDSFIAVLKLMGISALASSYKTFNIGNGKTSETIMLKLVGEIEGIIRISSYGEEIDFMVASIYENKIVKNFTYRSEDKEVEDLFRMLDEILIYI